MRKFRYLVFLVTSFYCTTTFAMEEHVKKTIYSDPKRHRITVPPLQNSNDQAGEDKMMVAACDITVAVPTNPAPQPDENQQLFQKACSFVGNDQEAVGALTELFAYSETDYSLEDRRNLRFQLTRLVKPSFKLGAPLSYDLKEITAAQIQCIKALIAWYKKK